LSVLLINQKYYNLAKIQFKFDKVVMLELIVNSKSGLKPQ